MTDEQNFEVGCGDKSITIGNEGDNVILNFITDTREGYVSQYMISENILSGSVVITRITGVPLDSPSSQGEPYNDLTTDHITITDYLTNGKGKVTFIGNATFAGKKNTYHYDDVNDLLENLVGTDTQNYAISLLTNATAGEIFDGSFLSEKITGTSSDDIIYGNDGNDYVVANGGDDIIYGGNGNDTLEGGNNNDIIFGNTGVNDLKGGNGNDILIGGTPDDTKVEYDENGRIVLDEDGRIKGLTYNENGEITDGIIWNNEGDKLSSGYGLDTIYAGVGDDTIYANSDTTNDKNIIYAGAGDDKIYVAGTKSGVENTVYGGSGSDTFIVSGTYGTNTIKDSSINDKLEHAAISGATYSYKREGDDLIIVQEKGALVQNTVLENHFLNYLNGTQLDDFKIGNDETSLLNDAIIAINVENNYTATAYSEVITLEGNNSHTITFGRNTGSTTVTGLKSNDVIKFSNVGFANIVFEKGTGEEANSLIISYDKDNEGVYQSNITIKNYFDDNGVKVENTIKTFNVNNANYTLEWRKSPYNETEDMYNIVSGIQKPVKDISNYVLGTNNDDNIAGQNKPDIFFGNGGNDTIIAGLKGSEIYGQDGDDILHGSDEDDYISGDNGNDTIISGTGDDIMSGGNGEDRYIYTTGDGIDIITDADFEDSIEFTDVKWKDLKFNQSGYDLEILYSEDDKVIIKNYYKDDEHTPDLKTPDANAINLIYTIDSTRPHKLIQANIALDRVARYDTEIAFQEDLVGKSDKNDFLTGSAGLNSWIDGLKGNDVLKGTAGYNVILGGDGNDTISGGRNIDEIYGGSGSDQIDGGSGDDIVWGDENNAFAIKNDEKSNDDIIAGGAGNDTIYGGTNYDEWSAAGSGNDIIDGGQGNDVIWGGSGDDTLSGGVGNDSFCFTINGVTKTSFGEDIIKDADKNDKILLRFVDTQTDDNVVFKNLTEEQVNAKLEYNRIDDDLIISAKDMAKDESGYITGTITINNFFKNKSAKNIDIIDIGNGQEISIIKNAVIDAYITAGDTFTGTDYSEVIDAKKDTTLKMGKGSNVIRFTSGQIGKNTNIILTPEEKLSLVFENNPAVVVDCKAADNKKDLILTVTKGETVEYITIQNYLSREIDTSIVISKHNGTIYEQDKEFFEVFGLFNQDSSDVTSSGTLTGTSTADKIDVTGYVSLTQKGVNINSGSGNDNITGSYYNDSIKSKYGDNIIQESAGINKISTGTGNDRVTVDNYSSNTINAGDGQNTIELQSYGTNKVTAGKHKDILNILSGNNTASLGNGENEVTIDGQTINKITTGRDKDTITVYQGTNTINSGAGKDEITLYNGANTITTASGDKNIIIDCNDIDIGAENSFDKYMTNKITTASGNDTFTICCGKNNINSGSGDDKFYINNQSIYTYDDDDNILTPNVSYNTTGGVNVIKTGAGSDTIEINAGENTVDSGTQDDLVIINAGTNNINLGAGNDTVRIAGGNNTILGAGGNDTYKFLTVNSGDTNSVITDAGGNDVYDLSSITNFNTMLEISDTKGKNELIIDSTAFDDNSGIFFDVIVGSKVRYNKDNDARYKLGNEVTLYKNLSTLTNGIEVTGRSALNVVSIKDNAGDTITNYTLNTSKIAQDVANFLAVKGYESAQDCLHGDNSNPSDISALLKLYNNNNTEGIEYALL